MPPINLLPVADLVCQTDVRVSIATKTEGVVQSTIHRGEWKLRAIGFLHLPNVPFEAIFFMLKSFFSRN
jgi:hypothetical protein